MPKNLDVSHCGNIFYKMVKHNRKRVVLEIYLYTIHFTSIYTFILIAIHSNNENIFGEIVDLQYLS